MTQEEITSQDGEEANDSPFKELVNEPTPEEVIAQKDAELAAANAKAEAAEQARIRAENAVIKEKGERKSIEKASDANIEDLVNQEVQKVLGSFQQQANEKGINIALEGIEDKYERKAVKEIIFSDLSPNVHERFSPDQIVATARTIANQRVGKDSKVDRTTTNDTTQSMYGAGGGSAPGKSDPVDEKKQEIMDGVKSMMKNTYGKRAE